MKIQLDQLVNNSPKSVLPNNSTLKIKGGTPVGTIGIDHIGENNSSEQEDATAQRVP